MSTWQAKAELLSRLSQTVKQQTDDSPERDRWTSVYLIPMTLDSLNETQNDDSSLGDEFCWLISPPERVHLCVHQRTLVSWQPHRWHDIRRSLTGPSSNVSAFYLLLFYSLATWSVFQDQHSWAAHIITGSSAAYTDVLFACWPLFTGLLLSSEQSSRGCTLIVWFVPARSLRYLYASGLLNGLKICSFTPCSHIIKQSLDTRQTCSIAAEPLVCCSVWFSGGLHCLCFCRVVYARLSGLSLDYSLFCSTLPPLTTSSLEPLPLPTYGD